MLLNAYWEPLEFELPAAEMNGDGEWHRWIDTALESPDDIVTWHDAPPVLGPTYRLESRSVAVLFSRGHGNARKD
jgi:glycogen operon protein